MGRIFQILKLEAVAKLNYLAHKSFFWACRIFFFTLK